MIACAFSLIVTWWPSFCMAQVRSELPKAFPKAKSMHKCQPLSIQADAKTNDLTGFKAML